jgi:hypothetical protein
MRSVGPQLTQILGPARLVVAVALVLAGCLPTPASGGEGRLAAEPGTLQAAGELGEVVRLALRVRHTGGRGDTRLQVAPSAPWLDVAPRSLTLDAEGSAELSVRVACPDVASSHFGWIAVDGEGLQVVVPVRLRCEGDATANLLALAGAAADAAAAADAGGEGALLRWEPPDLDDPILLRLTPEPNALHLDPERDYIIELPNEPLRRGINLSGGRNVVILGGEIDIPWQGAAPSIAARRALHLTSATGTIHVEGLLLHGDDISEGIQVNAPAAIVQIQNVAVLDIRARDQVGFTDNHPDLIQSYGNARELRVDRFTGSTDYQGLFFQADFHGPQHGPIRLSRVNITGRSTARYLLWFAPVPGSGDVVLDDVWLMVPEEREGGLGRAVWPNVAYDGASRAVVMAGSPYRVAWPTGAAPAITGHVSAGTPPGGDFAPPGQVGIGYRSPGYRLPSWGGSD